MMTDPIADMLSRVRNASSARLSSTKVPKSRVKRAIAEILKREGYLADVTDDADDHRCFRVKLKYGSDQRTILRGLRRASRPGRRLYVNRKKLPKVHNGLGIAVLSTSLGVVTDAEARQKGVGGEVLCEVW